MNHHAAYIFWVLPIVFCSEYNQENQNIYDIVTITVPNGTTILKLGKNYIEKIPVQYFTTDHSSLIKLELEFNQINFIGNYAFQH